MLTYKYEAREPGSGQRISSEVQADSERAAADMIKKMGYTPITITEKSSGLPLIGNFKIVYQQKNALSLLVSYRR